MDVLDLQAVLRFDSTDYTKGLSVAKKAAQTFAKAGIAAFSAATGATIAFGTSAVKTGMNFDKSMSQVYATMGSKAQEAIEYNDKMMSSADALRDFAKKTGATTAFTASQVADALNYMALAGYDATTAMATVPNVLNLALAGNMELAKASDMITDVQTAFGISLERSKQMVDEMAKAASTGNTNVEQLGDAFLVVGGLASELNGGVVTLSDGIEAETDNVQELEIALTAMANAGVKGSEAGTHMRNMLLKLTGPTEDGKLAFDRLGTSAFDAEGKMRSLKDIFGDMNRAFSGDLETPFKRFYEDVSKMSEKEISKALKKDENAMTMFGVSALDSAGKVKSFSQFMAEANVVMEKGVSQQDKLQAIQDLFNARDIASAKAILNSITGEYVKLGEEIYTIDDAYAKFGDDIYDSTKGFEYVQTSWDSIGESILDAEGAAEEMAKAQQENLTGSMNQFNSAMEGVKIELSEELIPTLTEFINLGTSGLQEVANAVREKGLLEAIPVAGKVFTKIIKEAVKKIPEVVKATVGIIKEVVKAVVDNVPTIVDALIEIIPTLVDGLGEILPTLIDGAFKLMIGVLNGLARLIPQIIPQIISIVSQIADAIIYNLEPLLDATINIIAVLSDALIDSLPMIIETAMTILDKIISYTNKPEIIEKLVELAAVVMVNLSAAFLAAAPKLLVGIGKIIKTVVENIIKTDWTFLGQKLMDNIQEALQKASLKLEQWWDGWAQMVGKYAAMGWNKLVDIWFGIGDWFNERWHDIQNVFSAIPNWFGNVFSKAWKRVVDAFSPMGDNFIAIGNNILTGLKSMVNFLINGINDVIAVPFNGLNAAFDTVRKAPMFSWLPSITVPQIPTLARGGVLKRGQMAFLEGQGDEAVIPLSQNTEWIDKIADKLSKKQPQYNININIDNISGGAEDAADRIVDVIINRLRGELASGAY
jgi:TP901 family phage tail tape measure protein